MAEPSGTGRDVAGSGGAGPTETGAEDLSWIPGRCPSGRHRMVAGGFTLTWQRCRCAWTDSTGGHHIAICKGAGCGRHYPPGCGPEQAQPQNQIRL